MDKQDLLRVIAETAYNVGYGAKKHFATFDLVEKLPGVLNFIGLGVGVFALYIDALAAKTVSAALVIMGISGIYVGMYADGRREYESRGIKLTDLFNRLKLLYFNVKASQASSFAQEEAELSQIQQEYNSVGLSKQIMFSDWYAHYKFFWQQQIEWIDEQKHFSFFRDMVPLTLYFAISAVLLAAVGAVMWCKYGFRLGCL